MTHAEYTKMRRDVRAMRVAMLTEETPDTNPDALDLPTAFVLGFGLGVVVATLLAMAIIG